MKTARQCIDNLLELETIKVWSLIVTLFGDLGRKSPVPLSGKEISRITGHIGIKPPAVRVALHRLKKEGWIETLKSEGDGREVSYVLSQKGFLQTIAACEDVYTSTAKYSDGWKLQLRQIEQVDTNQPQLNVFKHVALVPNAIANQDMNVMDLSLPRDGVPDWLVSKITPPSVETVAVNYAKILTDVDAILDQLESLDRSAIRLLALHHWRKMALRDNTWFHIWLFRNGSLSRCHHQIIQLLENIGTHEHH